MRNEAAAKDPQFSCCPIDIPACEKEKQKQKNLKTKKEIKNSKSKTNEIESDVSVENDRIFVMSELKFPALLSQGRHAEVMDVIVDTGAGQGYLLLPKTSKPQWSLDSCNYSVRLADGSVSHINHSLTATLRVDSTDYQVVLRVLPSRDKTASILAGRGLIQTLGLNLRGASVWSANNRLLCPSDCESAPIDAPVPTTTPTCTDTASASAVPDCQQVDRSPAMPMKTCPDIASASVVSDCRQAAMPSANIAETCSDTNNAFSVSECTQVNLPAVTDPAVANPVVMPSCHSRARSKSSLEKHWTTVVVDDSVFAMKETDEGPLVVESPTTDVEPMKLLNKCSGMCLPEAENAEESVIFESSEDDYNLATLILSEIADQKERQLLYCPSAQLELIPLSPNAKRDLPDQTHQFILRLPLPDSAPVSSAHRSYSRILYEKLKLEHRKQFDALTQQYVDAGWWVEVDSRDPRATSATDVFLHKAGSDKGRLVCDFRQFNKLFRDVSSSVPLIEHILLLMRTESFKHVFIGDCSKAFYRVKLSPPLPLQAGKRTFLCNRVSFGLSMGPETLRESLGFLLDSWKAHMSCRNKSGHLSLFIDDFQLLSEDDLKASLIHLLRRCGFAVSRKKAQMDYPISVFGCSIDKANECISASPPAFEQIKEIIDEFRLKPTKRLAFALGGKISYDPMRTHSKLKVLGDILRSVIGSYKISWDTVIHYACPEDKKLVDSLLSAIQELVSLPGEPSKISGKVSDIALFTDASIYGYGNVIDINDSLKLQIGGVWRKSQSSYHANRLEGLSLLRGMRYLAEFLRFKAATCFSAETLKPTIAIRTDSKTVLAWIGGRPPTDVMNSLEYRMLTRLQKALYSEAIELKLYGTVRISHISGSKNIDADTLSRIAADFRSFRSKKKPDPVCAIEDDSDFPDLSTNLPDFLELMAADCYDFPQFIERFRSICLAFDTLCNRFGNDRDPILRLVQILQRSLHANTQYIQQDGIFFHEFTDVTGARIKRPVLPSHFPRICELLIRTYHRQNGHRGSNYDVSFVLTRSPFFVEKSLRTCQRVISKCLICAMHRTRPVVCEPAHTVPRDFTLPPFTRLSVDILHITKRDLVLTAMCIDTGLLCLIHATDLTIGSISAALKILACRYCVNLKYIHWDNAPTFVSAKMKNDLLLSGHPDIEFSFTPPGGSKQNPIERCHREVWSIIRSRGFVKKLRNVQEWKSRLEEIACVINQRPLCRTDDDRILTPCSLAFGSSYGLDGSRVQAVREYFYTQCFLIRRRRHNPHQRRAQLVTGAFVLVHKPNPTKDELPYQVGRLIENAAGVAIVRMGGKNVRVPVTSIAPLESVDSPEGRVVTESTESTREMSLSTSQPSASIQN